jgi:hypothetical protein
VERHVQQRLRSMQSLSSLRIQADQNDFQKYLVHQIESDINDIEMGLDIRNEIITHISTVSNGMLVIGNSYLR